MIESFCIVTLRQIVHLVAILALYDRFNRGKINGSTFDTFVSPRGRLPNVMRRIVSNVQWRLQNVHQALPISIPGPKLSHGVQILETRRESRRNRRTATALNNGAIVEVVTPDGAVEGEFVRAEVESSRGALRLRGIVRLDGLQSGR